MADERDYLGFGYGLGLEINNDGLLCSIIMGRRRFPIYEWSEDEYQCIDKPILRERNFSVQPGQIFMGSQKVDYFYQGKHTERTILIYPEINQVEIIYSKVKKTIVTGFRNISPVEKKHRFQVESSCAAFKSKINIDVKCTDLNGKDFPLQSDENEIKLGVEPGLKLILAIEPQPRFEPVFVIAGTLEMGALISSGFHNRDKYLPLLFIEDESISAKLHIYISQLFRMLNCESYILGGIGQKAVDDLLWDKSSEFRSRCKIFSDDAELAGDPQYANLDILKCRSGQIPQGVLMARRQGLRLVIDENAPSIPHSNREPTRDVVSYEGITPGAIIAANYAFFFDAELIEIGEIQEPSKGKINVMIGGLHNIGDKEVKISVDEINRRVDHLTSYIKSITKQDLSRAASLTAFTTGIPYSACYDIPVGHFLDHSSDIAVLKHLSYDGLNLAPNLISLLIATEHFPENEISQSLRDIPENIFNIIVSGDHAIKSEMLFKMALIPFDLQVIVAHGWPEIFYEDVYRVSTAQGEEMIKVENSNRNIPNLTGIDLHDIQNMECISRQITRQTSGIEGIMMNDALITGEDLRFISNIPLFWGIVINNGCATWTSLGPAFMTQGAHGYIGTLWPVSHTMALKVGVSLLTKCMELPIAQILHDSLKGADLMDRFNYVYMGSPFFQLTSEKFQLGETREIYLTLINLEGQFQNVISKVESGLIPHYLSRIEGIRSPFYEHLIIKDPTFRPFLLKLKGDLLALVESRTGYRGDFMPVYKQAIESLTEILTGARSNVLSRFTVDEKFLKEFKIEIQLQMFKANLRNDQFNIARKIMEDILCSLDEATSDQLKAMVLKHRSALATILGDKKQSAEIIKEAIQQGIIEEKAGNEILLELNQPISTTSLLDRKNIYLEKLLGTIWDPLEAARHLFAQAETYRNAGDFTSAYQCYYRCLGTFQEEGEYRAEAKVYNNLGLLYQINKKYDDARKCFEKSLAVREMLGADTGNPLLNLGNLEKDDPGKAINYYNRALEVFEKENYPKGIAEVSIKKAEILAKQGKADDAQTVIERGVKIGEQINDWIILANARIRRGFIHFQKGDLNAGIPDLFFGIDIFKKLNVSTEESLDAEVVAEFIDKSVNLGHVRNILENGTQEKDISDSYRTARELIGEKAMDELLKGLYAANLHRGDYTLAETVFDLKPSIFTDEQRMSLYKSLGQLGEGIEMLSKRLREIDKKKRPTEYAKLNLDIGHLYKMNGHWREAVKHLNESCRVYRERGNKQYTYIALVEMGNSLIEEERWEDALNCFNEALDYYLNTPEELTNLGRLYNNIGYLYARQEKVKDAIKHYRKAIETIGEKDDTTTILAFVNIGELSVRHQDIKQAKEAFREVRKLTEFKDDSEADAQKLRWRISSTLNLASILSFEEHYIETFKLCLDALKLLSFLQDSTLIQHGFKVLEIASAGGFDSEAKKCLLKAIYHGRRNNPQMYIPYLSCAVAWLDNDFEQILTIVHHIREGEPDVALGICNSILDRKPDYFRAHLVRGRCLEEIKKWYLAGEEYDWCIQAQPANAVPWNNKAHTLYHLGKYEEAIRCAERSIELNPNYLHPLELKGMICLQLERFQEVEDALKKYLEIMSILGIGDKKKQKDFRAILFAIQAKKFDEIGKLLKIYLK